MRIFEGARVVCREIEISVCLVSFFWISLDGGRPPTLYDFIDSFVLLTIKGIFWVYI